MDIVEGRMPFFMDGYDGDDSSENGSNDTDSGHDDSHGGDDYGDSEG